MNYKSHFSKNILAPLILVCLFSACDDEPVVNAEPEIIINDFTISRILADRSTGVDYRIDGCIDVLSSAILTIEPGVVIEFTQNSCLEISDFAVLNAVGTANKPIVFTGQQKTKGFWKGISFSETNNTNNQLAYCTIEYAGNQLPTASSSNKAALIIGNSTSDPARLVLNNVTVQHNLNAGVYIYADSFVDALKNCTFTDNDEPIIVIGKAIGYLDPDNDFTGNTKDHIVWLTTSADSESDNATFTVKKLAVPYYLGSTSYSSSLGGHLIINAGVRMIMKAGVNMSANQGTITMNGTANDRIILEGENYAPNTWDGVVARSTGVLNMNYVNVSDGGESSGATQGMITHASNGQLQVTNCIFSNYAYYGLSFASGDPHNADIATSNICTGNTGLGCVYER